MEKETVGKIANELIDLIKKETKSSDDARIILRAMNEILEGRIWTEDDWE